MCIMCGCGKAGNGDITSPDTPMMVITNIFGGDIDSMDESGLDDSDSMSTSTSTGAVINDND